MGQTYNKPFLLLGCQAYNEIGTFAVVIERNREIYIKKLIKLRYLISTAVTRAFTAVCVPENVEEV
jgi:hypothetical protein